MRQASHSLAFPIPIETRSNALLCHSLNSRPNSLVDFFAYKKVGQLQRFEPLRENLSLILKLLELYLAILNDNGSIARYSNVPLFANRIEARISESFSCPHP